MADQLGPAGRPRPDDDPRPIDDPRPAEADVGSPGQAPAASGPAAGAALPNLDVHDVAYLAAASEALASTLDPETTLQLVAKLAVPTLGDWCIVDMLDEDGRPRRVAGAHADPAREPLIEELRRYPPRIDSGYGIGAALTSGVPVVQASISDADLLRAATSPGHLAALRALDRHSLLVAPLIARGRTLGSIMLAATTGRRAFREGDVPLVADLARRAALAVDNARLFAAQQSARRQAEAAEARYRALFEGTADAVAVLDASGAILDVNAALVRLVGFSLEELRAEPPFSRLVGAETWRAEHLPRLLADGVWTGEVGVHIRDGRVVEVEARVAAVKLPTGPVLVAALRDISERRALQRLEQELITMVSHELKNPVTAIRGYTELMQRTVTPNERALATIVRQTRRLERLIDDLLDASRLAAGRLPLRPGPIDMMALVAEAVEQARTLSTDHTIRAVAPSAAVGASAAPDSRPPAGAGSQGVRATSGADAGGGARPFAWGDRDRLDQVLQNLLSNAAKYSPAGSTIAVGLDADDRELTVSVSDTGPGITPEVLPRLFERFTRAPGADRTAAGLGLGLYISRMLVEAHGGRIWVESSPGSGARFAFTVPRRAPRPSLADDDSAPRSPASDPHAPSQAGAVTSPEGGASAGA